MSYSTADREWFDGKPRPTVFQYQTHAHLNQAAPVQNTWYTVLNTTNARLQLVDIYVETTNETLEIRLTIDNDTCTGSVAATAGTVYYAFMSYDGELVISNSFPSQTFLQEGREVLVEVRKTTAAGAGNLHGRVNYWRIP